MAAEHRERLQKVLAQAGVASRRQIEQYILAGRITVNGLPVTVLGTKVQPGDEICVDGKPVEQGETLCYYLLNKPAGVISSARDPQGRRTVVDLLKDVPARIYPVGRLDLDTSGLIVLTNDGELAHRLMHPSYGVFKTYRALVHGSVGGKALSRLESGVMLEDGKTAPAEVRRNGFVQRVIEQKTTRLELIEITIHEGKNRQVRRMFEAIGSPVVELERIAFGPLRSAKQLPPGNYRALSQEEVKKLRSLVGLA